VSHNHSHTSAGDRHSRSLLVVLTITAAFMVVEVVTAVLTDSLVLLADAGHMLTDVAGVALALGAIHYARRPANQRKTYGYYRAEILAALANAVLLLAVAAYIFYEAFQRFTDPPEVDSVPLLAVASGGLVVNIIAARILHSGAQESMNVRGAFLEVWKDILGSVAAIAAALIILTTGWRYADPILAAAVGALILPRTWDLLKGALDVLFEGAPAHLDTADVSREMMSVPGVAAVHDLHIWTVTSGFVSLSAHVETDQTRGQHDILVDLRKCLAERFSVDHATLQIETHALHEELEACCGVDAGRASVAHAARHH
jgi:cobalt-zinc-cadmium efflux system protein